MSATTALMSTPLLDHPDVKLIASGKVREIYEIKDDPRHLLFVTTDKISAFDVVLSTPIPDKGAVLTMLSKFWFDLLKTEMPDVQSHFVYMGLPASLKSKLSKEDAAALEHRSMVVKRLEVIPIESICRGYITGSAWSSYKKDNTVNGVPVAPGLREPDKFPEIQWTPSTKAPPGEHDENISAARAAEIVGTDIAKQVESLSKRIYAKAMEYAAQKGILIADTKFEFALDKSTSPPTVVLCDEVLTPDSSRFWNAETYKPGESQPSMDKQALRDWLSSSGLKGKDGVELPGDVVKRTEERYKAAYEALTGKSFKDEVR